MKIFARKIGLRTNNFIVFHKTHNLLALQLPDFGDRGLPIVGLHVIIVLTGGQPGRK